ncbi:MAG TPA: hypothetical protein VKC11_13920 [Steroidobacteraceae bacterium]|nr:hypothetical protein [Steroidobacteraceae bacterium]
MQQATSSIGSSVAAGNAMPPAAVSYVINLCASTTPVGLEQPNDPALKQFRFFVSRRREDGRERFRLHMGYFPSQEAAEQMLAAVRDVYPAAWAGVAPGQKLRARAAGQTVAPPALPVPNVPTVALVAESTTAFAMPARPVAPLRLGAVPGLPRAAPVVTNDGAAAARSLKNVRAAIDSLNDAPSRAALPAAAPALEGKAVLRLLEAARPAPAARVAPRAPHAPSAPPMPRAQPAASAPPTPRAPAARSVLPAPGARVAAPTELVAYAVQLRWSVQAIDLSLVPQLAIFAAYTLYGVEGNRDGRRWYGLRLGFFTDAVSAKQVAHYVRSEFNAVSIVPVTARERERATASTAKPLPALTAPKSSGPELSFIDDARADSATTGIRPVLASTAPVTPLDKAAAAKFAMAAAAGLPTPSSPGTKPARSGPGKRPKLRVAQGTKPMSKRVRQSGPPLSLEETLEILGAGELQMDSGRGVLMNDASRRDRKHAPKTSSRFGRLISRLADRLGEDRSG